MENRIVVTICDQEYTLVAEESASYMQKVGSYVSEKMEEILATARVGRTDAAVLTAVNLGGLGTLIASLASLISFKAYAKEYPEKKGRYLFCFALWNVGFLAVLTAAAVWLGA